MFATPSTSPSNRGVCDRCRSAAPALAARLSARTSRSAACCLSRRCCAYASSRRRLQERCLSKSSRARSGVTARGSPGVVDATAGRKVHSLTSWRRASARSSCSLRRFLSSHASPRAWSEAGPAPSGSSARSARAAPGSNGSLAVGASRAESSFSRCSRCSRCSAHSRERWKLPNGLLASITWPPLCTADEASGGLASTPDAAITPSWPERFRPCCGRVKLVPLVATPMADAATASEVATLVSILAQMSQVQGLLAASGLVDGDLELAVERVTGDAVPSTGSPSQDMDPRAKADTESPASTISDTGDESETAPRAKAAKLKSLDGSLRTAPIVFGARSAVLGRWHLPESVPPEGDGRPLDAPPACSSATSCAAVSTFARASARAVPAELLLLPKPLTKTFGVPGKLCDRLPMLGGSCAWSANSSMLKSTSAAQRYCRRPRW
mmetsp:Transcript_55229/g.176996  ORF Transcript_55229/g.176996 Transcript_55229/m.176996 type:complete len:441 (+) Transcript_55229:1211-2533(+)